MMRRVTVTFPGEEGHQAFRLVLQELGITGYLGGERWSTVITERELYRVIAERRGVLEDRSPSVHLVKPSLRPCGHYVDEDSPWRGGRAVFKL